MFVRRSVLALHLNLSFNVLMGPLKDMFVSGVIRVPAVSGHFLHALLPPLHLLLFVRFVMVHVQMMFGNVLAVGLRPGSVHGTIRLSSVGGLFLHALIHH
jgi:hypothetical protein